MNRHAADIVVEMVAGSGTAEGEVVSGSGTAVGETEKSTVETIVGPLQLPVWNPATYAPDIGEWVTVTHDEPMMNAIPNVSKYGLEA